MFSFIHNTPLLSKAYKKWMAFAHILGTINGYTIFSIMYVVIFGIYAIVERFFRAVFKVFFHLFPRDEKQDRQTSWVLSIRHSLSESDIEKPF